MNTTPAEEKRLKNFGNKEFLFGDLKVLMDDYGIIGIDTQSYFGKG
ncbi:hypothetical protein [Halobacillus sp. B23F22_1]